MAAFSRADKRKQVLAVLDEVARSIEHLPRVALVKMLPVLDQAHRELETSLKHWLAREQGETLFSTQRYRNALVAVRHAQARAQRKLGPNAEGALWTAAERTGKLATHHLVHELEKFGQIFEGTIHPVSIDQAAVIASGDRLLFTQFASSAKRYAGLVGEAVVRELAVSRVKSETIDELTNRLQRRLPAFFAEDRNSAARLARTETMNAYNVYHFEGLQQIAEDDPEVIARWDASFDWRRCPMCASLDGQTHDVAQGEKFVAHWMSRSKKRGVREHKKVLERPPAHPNCRCVLTPWREGWDETSRPGRPRNDQDRDHTEATAA